MNPKALDDVMISRAIVETFNNTFTEHLKVDVAIAGGGPAWLMAAYDLARAGHKVALFERKLSLGGGMWGGGVGFNIIVVQEQGREILEELGVRTAVYQDGYYTASSVETVAALILKASQAGAAIFNLYSVEDVAVNDGRICGVVINSSAIEVAGLHVDPITVHSKYVIEATGHPLEVVKKVVEKSGLKLNTPSGGIEGEKSMNAELGERAVVENTVEIAPGLFVAGMAANAAFGAYRMGPIFGGMLLSGRAAARKISELLKG